jgi:hypothetical protein
LDSVGGYGAWTGPFVVMFLTNKKLCQHAYHGSGSRYSLLKHGMFGCCSPQFLRSSKLVPCVSRCTGCRECFCNNFCRLCNVFWKHNLPEWGRSASQLLHHLPVLPRRCLPRCQIAKGTFISAVSSNVLMDWLVSWHLCLSHAKDYVVLKGPRFSGKLSCFELVRE